VVDILVNKNTTSNEYISLLMDNEVDGELCQSAINKILKSDDLNIQWTRYHLARELLVETDVQLAEENFAAKVANMIADEPHRIGATDWKKSSTNQGNPKKSWLRQAVGFAVAASVTALVVTGVNNLGPSLEKVSSKPQFSTNFAPIIDNVVPASAGFQVPSKVPNLEDQQRLQRLFLQHTMSASENGLKGFLPYAKVVSYRRIPTSVAKIENPNSKNLKQESQSGNKDIDSNTKN